jgi:peptide/nickel transport system permease protein
MTDLVATPRVGLLTQRPGRRDVILLVSGLWIAAIVAFAVFAPLITRYDPLAVDPAHTLQAPSAAHLLGTDRQGRDELSRLAFGTRTALFGALGTLAISVTLGTILGMVAAYLGGTRGNLIMRGLEVLMSFPSIILAIVFVAALGLGLTKAMLGLALVYTPITARVIRSQALIQVREQYISAARGLGYGAPRVIARHLFPNVTSQVIVQASITLPYALVDLAALSFLGLGVQPPTPDWGNMLADGQISMLLAPWLVISPALAIVSLVLPWNLFASELRGRLDPKKY